MKLHGSDIPCNFIGQNGRDDGQRMNLAGGWRTVSQQFNYLVRYLFKIHPSPLNELPYTVTTRLPNLDPSLRVPRAVLRGVDQPVRVSTLPERRHVHGQPLGLHVPLLPRLDRDAVQRARGSDGTQQQQRRGLREQPLHSRRLRGDPVAGRQVLLLAR